jgi:peptide/nickel transport system ATP-binding protein
VAENNLLLEVKDLKTHFFLERGVVKAVDGISYEIEPGQTLGVLGESGCGKSVTAYSVMRLIRSPGRTVSGQILLHRAGYDEAPVDLTQLDPQGREMRSIRGSDIAMVFQEPTTYLNPVYTIGDQIMEAVTLHQRVSKQKARDIAIETLDKVRMPYPDQVVDRYPHQLSGGMRQRAIIAIALSCQPTLLIADEPTTALDVTTEGQILELMRDLQRELGMAIQYITHDLGVIAEMADEVIVMYLGKVVEHATVHNIFHNPKHPYTQALLRSIPVLGRKTGGRLEAIRGVVPDPLNIPSGCRFRNRCPSAIAGTCEVEEPEMVDVDEGHLVRCFLYG